MLRCINITDKLLAFAKIMSVKYDVFWGAELIAILFGIYFLFTRVLIFAYSRERVQSGTYHLLHFKGFICMFIIRMHTSTPFFLFPLLMISKFVVLDQ